MHLTLPIAVPGGSVATNASITKAAVSRSTASRKLRRRASQNDLVPDRTNSPDVVMKWKRPGDPTTRRGPDPTPG